MVDAHEDAERGVEDEPGGEETVCQGSRARELDGGEDEGDGGEEEAGFLVGD